MKTESKFEILVGKTGTDIILEKHTTKPFLPFKLKEKFPPKKEKPPKELFLV
jgi:hypothetical protein